MPADLPVARMRVAASLNGRLHLGMLGVAEMTEVRSQIAGADEDAVDAFDGRDGLNLLQGGARFNLHQHAGVEMRVLVVAL